MCDLFKEYIIPWDFLKIFCNAFWLFKKQQKFLIL